MSALLGTSLAEDYIQVGPYKLPVPQAPSDQTEWGVLHFTPLEPYSASTVLGDDALVSDDRIATMIWSNMARGIGVNAYQEGQSMSGAADGDLDLSMGSFVTLPPRKVALASLDAAFANAPPIYIEGINPAANTWVAWNRSANGLRYHNGTAWSTPTTSGLNTSVVYGFERFAGLYIVSTSIGVFTSPDGATWTLRWTQPLHGLCVHDEKLYGFGPLTGRLLWVSTQAELTSGTAWANASTSALNLRPGEFMSQLLEWVDKTGDNTVVLITDQRIFFYNDADYFTQFWPKRYGSMRKGGWPNAHVWARDDRLYLTQFPYNDNILTFDHQTIDDSGANKEGGITNAQRFSVSHLSGNTRYLHAFCPPRTGETKAGRVMKATEAFGWTVLNRGKLVDPEDFDSAVTARVTGGGYADDYTITCFHTGLVERQWTPDRGDLQHNVTDQEYEQGFLWLYSGEADASLANIDKLAKWWRLDFERVDGTPGIPPGAGVVFKHRLDGGRWEYVMVAVPEGALLSGLLALWGQASSNQQWPAIIPLPTRENQQGVPFYKVEWAIGLARSTVGTTPLLRSVTLAYLRTPDIYDGIQVPIDLSKERWEGFEDRRFHGLDRQSAWRVVQQLKAGPGQVKRTWPVTIARGGTMLHYPAMDVRVSGNVDPQDNLGRVDLTLRDTTAPPSGLRTTEGTRVGWDARPLRAG